MMKKINHNLLFILFTFLIHSTAFAQIKLPKVLSDNMVLQQGKRVNIWGKSKPNERIIIRFQKQVKKTNADESGNWYVILDELKGTKIPQQLIIQGVNEKVIRKNILIGEVWLASGQSNMEYSMNNHPQYAKPQKGDKDYLYKEYKSANNPNIRLLYVEKNIKTDTLPSLGWQTIDKETLAPISAIGYFFAKSLIENIDVPIGIISTSWGGTPIETWTPELAYQNSHVFKNSVRDSKLNGIRIGERFEKMVKPMIPYTLRGFLWYQGEQNLINGETEIYAEKQKLLIDNWRSVWDDQELSFYYVQLAPYTYSQRRRDIIPKTWEALPVFREVQTSCMSIPRTGMVITTDLVDNPKDIHSSYKWIIGERLSRWALANDYGKTEVIFSGPTFKKMTEVEDKIIIEFDNIGSGLITNDGKSPNWFYVKDKSGRFDKVTATIENDKIIIPAANISKPASVRFGWDEIAMPNLFNKEGLPAVPFRTDYLR